VAAAENQRSLLDMSKTDSPSPPQQPALSYVRYLDAKRTVDDRALNQHVVTVLTRELAALPEPVKVLEIGAGLGTMVARVADWGVLRRSDYTLLDVDQQSLEAAPSWLAGWAAGCGRSVERLPSAIRVQGGSPEIDFTVRTTCAEIGRFLDGHQQRGDVDLLIANALLDLVDVAATLPALFDLLHPNGLYWFSVNFDGETIFLPEHPSDAALMQVYHGSMDQRLCSGRPAGDSRSGRHLFMHLRAARATILACGSSDWVVHATDGAYANDEGQFLRHILYTIEMELNRRSEVDQPALQAWLHARHDQLARGELVYIAHQLDFVGRRAGDMRTQARDRAR
jgi:SAM-dependent methyltransferase